MLEPKEFESCFRSWVASVCSIEDSEIISIDGKTLCGSRDANKSPLHLVSAWANQNQLDVKGCIITADAMSCQKAITAKIVEKDADYVIGLKDNQPNLKRECAEFFDDFLTAPENFPEVIHFHTADKGHGRSEIRDYYLTTNLGWVQYADGWTSLNSLGMAVSKVTTGEKTSVERRYYISSLTDVKQFAQAARAHWGIENSLHWCLDVTFHEDYSTGVWT